VKTPAWVSGTALLVVFGLLALGCHREPGPGDSCKPGDIRCLDPKTELACQKGTFVSAPCKGPMGCREDGKHLTCDVTGNLEGDPCSSDDEGAAQCIGDRQRITCRGSRYSIEFCRGPSGCRAGSGSVRCDQSQAAVGDPCQGRTSACSADGKGVLSCYGGKVAVAAQCPGPGGCALRDGEVDCDLGKKDDGRKAKPAR